MFTFLALMILAVGCGEDGPEASLVLKNAYAGSVSLDLNATTENVPVDRAITLSFSAALNESTLEDGITLTANGTPVSITRSLSSVSSSVNLSVTGTLLDDQVYTVTVSDALKSTSGASAMPVSFTFKTSANALQLLHVYLDGEMLSGTSRLQNVPVDPVFTFEFSTPINFESFQKALSLTGASVNAVSAEDHRTVEVSPSSSLGYLKKYTLSISGQLTSEAGGSFDGYSREFYTQLDSTYKFPEISEEELLTKVQEQTFQYFWDFAHPVSGLARERNTSGNTVTIGGSGFGVMAILVGMERGFISRQQGIDRLEKIVDFLADADRFHGVWPHWMNGETGETIPFSANDDGADLVETSFMLEGLLTVRQYLDTGDPQELDLRNKITQLWETVEFDWFTRDGENVLYWHWSPNVGWAMNHQIRGWNEALIVYVLAASSPTHPISRQVYENGWAGNGDMRNGNEYYGITLPLGTDRGGPLFFSHYSFLGLDPRNLEDQYANYWEQNVAHSRINQAYCIQNPQHYVGYGENCWGLTASDNQDGYSAHSPTNDLGVITPTAALSSMPYTPDASLAAMKHFYYLLGDRLWGEYGFYDAFNNTENWYATSYLAIDEGPIVGMIENYRTALLWDLFMQDEEVRSGLDKLGFTY